MHADVHAPAKRAARSECAARTAASVRLPPRPHIAGGSQHETGRVAREAYGML